MAETWASALRQMGPLVLGSVGGLALSSARHQPATVALSAVLSLALGKMTFNLGGVPTVFDGAREASALQSLVTTSRANRAVRALLGACYLYGAVTMSLRSTEACSEREGTVLWRVTRRAAGCAALCFVGLTWISTGYYGQ
jgi:hypothetical protein